MQEESDEDDEDNDDEEDDKEDEDNDEDDDEDDEEEDEEQPKPMKEVNRFDNVLSKSSSNTMSPPMATQIPVNIETVTRASFTESSLSSEAMYRNAMEKNGKSVRLEQKTKDTKTAVMQCQTLWHQRKFFKSIRDPILDIDGNIYKDVCKHLGYIPDEEGSQRWWEKQTKNGGRKMVFKALQERRNTKMGDIKKKLIGKYHIVE